MFDKLFEMFNKISPEQTKTPVYEEPISAPLPVSGRQGPPQGTMIGYNYLNHPDDKTFEPTKQRFTKLSEFLRGRYK